MFSLALLLASTALLGNHGFVQATTPYDCTFENSFCGWTQDQGDVFNWRRQKGSTGTFETGPAFDHTRFGTRLGYYVYIESSLPQQTGHTARLISSSIPAGQRCLNFFYHMYGLTIGELNVYVQTSSSNMTKIFGMEGGKGLAWIEAREDIYFNTTYRIVFEGVTGIGSTGDLAIDDITVPVGKCPPLPVGSDSSFDCTFEYGLCGWTQDDTDEFDWWNNQGPTYTNNTGPSTDKTIGNDRGVYLYLEADKPKPGEKARLISSPVSPGEKCVRFFYHLYGIDTGLTVYIRQTGSKMTKIFGEQGDKGDRWLEGRVSINPSATSQIIFEAVRGSGHEGDTAIDDVSLTVGKCPTVSLPDDVTCLAKEVMSNEDLKLVNLKCTANQVFPEAVCEFYQKTDDGMFVPIKAEPNYVHIRNNDAASYNSTCEVSLYPKELGEGTHNFQAFVYPNVTGGRNMVNATELEGTVKLWHAKVSHECPESLLDDYLCGKPTYCNCTVVMEGWPKGTIAWYEDGSTRRPNPLPLMFDENNPDAYYHCQSVSQIGRSPVSRLKIETDISCN